MNYVMDRAEQLKHLITVMVGYVKRWIVLQVCDKLKTGLLQNQHQNQTITPLLSAFLHTANTIFSISICMKYCAESVLTCPFINHSGKDGRLLKWGRPTIVDLLSPNADFYIKTGICDAENQIMNISKVKSAQESRTQREWVYDRCLDLVVCIYPCMYLIFCVLWGFHYLRAVRA